MNGREIFEVTHFNYRHEHVIGFTDTLEQAQEFAARFAADLDTFEMPLQWKHVSDNYWLCEERHFGYEDLIILRRTIGEYYPMITRDTQTAKGIEDEKRT